MLRRILLTAILGVSGILAFAQSGTIKGSVKDGLSGEAVIGANVMVLGTGQGTVADINGDFQIAKVKAGTYTVVVSFISYKTDTLKNITVYPDQTTLINTKIVEASQELNEIVVTGQKMTNTDLAVITELRKNDLVAVGISAQQISMSQDRDAAQVMRRIPGVTIIGNRFVNVRGLSERYSTVMLNGVIAPSSEVDSKAFAFDLIPSGLIDRMLVYKSGGAELPGEFGGAVIGITTKNIVGENSMSLTVSGGYRGNTTFSDFLSDKKASGDWLGFGASDRELPSAFPKDKLKEANSDSEESALAAVSKMLPSRWKTYSNTAAPDLRIGFDLSRAFSLGGVKVNNITSISYSRTNQHISSVQHYYEAFNETTQESSPRNEYFDERYNQQVRLGVISNFTVEINPANKIEFRNFYNQQGISQTIIRTGEILVTGWDVNNISLNYQSRGIYSGQLQGTHSLSDHIKWTWIGGYSETSADQPDYRRATSQRPTGTDLPFSINIPPGATAQDAGRFFSDLNEKVYTGTTNVEIKLNPEQTEEDKQMKINVGGYYEDKKRDFNARWMSYTWMRNATDFDLLTNSYDVVFANENIGTKFVLSEGTNQGPDLFDKYEGKSTLLAGYVGAAIPFASKFRFSGGLRVEDSHQMLDVTYEGNTLRKADLKVTTPMPFANLSYNLNEKMLVRAAFSRTVNRPVFRELAPFNFYDFERNADIQGNPDLQVADINNIDLRWEYYPSQSENISFGGFYKDFKNPIELLFIGGSNVLYSYANAKSAYSFGVEAEVRKSLAGLTGSAFVDNMSFLFNGALIHSRVTVRTDGQFQNQIENRALQGQSPYVINAGVLYNNSENGLQFNVMYNVIGKRIFAVGDKLGNATQYEMPRNMLDVTVSKQVSEKIEIKFGVQDILNQKYRIVQDSNSDNKIGSVDESVQEFRPGQLATLGVAIKLQ